MPERQRENCSACSHRSFTVLQPEALFPKQEKEWRCWLYQGMGDRSKSHGPQPILPPHPIALSSFHIKISEKKHGRGEKSKTSCCLTSVYQAWKYSYMEGWRLAERALVSVKGLKNTPPNSLLEQHQRKRATRVRTGDLPDSEDWAVEHPALASGKQGFTFHSDIYFYGSNRVWSK